MREENRRTRRKTLETEKRTNTNATHLWRRVRESNLGHCATSAPHRLVGSRGPQYTALTIGSLIENDQQGAWSPEKDCCLRLTYRQPLQKPSSESRWLPHRLWKRQSPTTVLLRTPVMQMIIFNHGMLLPMESSIGFGMVVFIQ